MNLYELLGSLDTNDFTSLSSFSEFAEHFLEFIANDGMQADIVSKNESNYHFFQYREEGQHCVTRPINMNLFLSADNIAECRKNFEYSLKNIKSIKDEPELRANINKYIYTCQQCIGAALDAFNNSNKARKRNGNLFELLIRNVISEIGVDVSSGDEYLEIGPDEDKMKFQHDVILKNIPGEVKAIGQLKTSSKDRLDKIFLDKYMYNKLSNTDIPHFAIFLNDVQRKGKSPKFGINSTFLPGHFFAYTIALNPLNGVYYFDLRPNMENESFLSSRIKTFDKFIVEDIWELL